MDVIENIKKAGLKLTPQRVAVYEAMMELGHAQLETIVQHLNERYGQVTLSTVYRVLESFCHAGLLSLVCHPETGDCYYDITVKGHHHVFGGERIVDYDDEGLTQLVRDYLREHRPDLIDIEKIQVLVTTNNL
ncbi:MAG: transcriptional repressor [Bacteroidaceae bacterium]|nr:transcriptional repressor [Bacteroidaceae bacterium]